MSDTAAKITALKKKLGDNLCILGHHYQNDAIAAHCDIMGDSLELARKIPEIQAKHIVFCGVYFMGETAALLAQPDQKIYLPEPDADCMMSLMASAKMARSVLEELNVNGRRIIPLAYVNTMLELKDVVGKFGGAVCTSANASTMLEWALSQGDGVLFLPDRHLGANTAKKIGLKPEEIYTLRLRGKGLLPGQEKNLGARLLLWPGSCAVHAKLTPQSVTRVRDEFKNCRVIAHPECRQEVIDYCDGAGSTSWIIKEVAKEARENPGATVIIGTEENLVERLANQYKNDLKIHKLGRAFCPHMDKVTPQKLLNALLAIEAGMAESVDAADELRENATLSIKRMLDVCAKKAN